MAGKPVRNEESRKFSSTLHLLYMHLSRSSPALVPYSCCILHLPQHFPAEGRDGGGEASSSCEGLPETVAHEVRPFRTAIITFQVLQDAGFQCDLK